MKLPFLQSSVPAWPHSATPISRSCGECAGQWGCERSLCLPIRRDRKERCYVGYPERARGFLLPSPSNMLTKAFITHTCKVGLQLLSFWGNGGCLFRGESYVCACVDLGPSMQSPAEVFCKVYGSSLYGFQMSGKRRTCPPF